MDTVWKEKKHGILIQTIWSALFVTTDVSFILLLLDKFGSTLPIRSFIWKEEKGHTLIRFVGGYS